MRFLKRFPEDKHEQIRQVMSYIQMCGLTGKDLVSIGGYIDRQRRAEIYRNAVERVKAYDAKPMGNDYRSSVYTKFKLKTDHGTYTFAESGWNHWEVRSNKTRIKKQHKVTNREWPSHVSWSRQCFYDMILDISDGVFKLDF